MTIISLWQPILAAAVVTFIAGAVIWMAMPWHRSDFSKTSNEEAVRAALKDLPPGAYAVPYALDNNDFNNPEIQKKYEEGPVAYCNVLPSGMPAMGKRLLQMFLYNLLVAAVCAYFVSRTLPSGADYLAVFRIAGTAAFIAYGIAYIQESIWFGRPWSTTVKNLFDALLYGLLVGGVFGWLV